MSKKVYIALAAMTLVGSSVAAVNAGGELYARTINVFAARAIIEKIDAAPLSIRRHAHRTSYPECRFEKQERWSRRRGETVMRNIKVCG